MKLKQYQEDVLNILKTYLNNLSKERQIYQDLIQIKPDYATRLNFTEEAWQKTKNECQSQRYKNGLNEFLPDIFYKIPTGGGKTLIACHSIGLIQQMYIQKQTGLILWIVPTNQIYKQTLKAFRDREHPYRQVLDFFSAGKTLIKEKTDKFNRLDIEENLLILLLMLPSANRKSKETLKIFQDSDGYTDFFPPEDFTQEHIKLLEQFPNLDCFSTENEVFNTLIKTSLGNTLRLLKPLILIDEGHKAYSKQARETIHGFNPSFVLELSATPPEGVNKLVSISGKTLNEYEMIKLDIHLTNKASIDWKDTMLSSIEKRNNLEDKANEYEQNTGLHIRPINLIQVERTGKETRGSGFIHSEDVKEYLIKQCNIPLEQIAIKSSEKDDIEGIDLFAKDCQIRYIITRFALQEGWDCSFAYLLTILTNPSSDTSITQLIGRILRQPYAHKTGIKELDECYVYTYRTNARDLVVQIKKGLEEEGLGDISGHLISNSGETADSQLKEREVHYRERFKKFEGKIYLPRFVMQTENNWRDIKYEVDILSNIPWMEMDISEIANLTLQKNKEQEQQIDISLSEDERELLKTKRVESSQGTLKIDDVFMAQQLSDVIPNPWVCIHYAQKAIELLKEKHGSQLIESNFVFIIEELKKLLLKELNRLSELVFKQLLDDKKLCFFLQTAEGNFVLPSHITVRSNKQLNRVDNTYLQADLFDYEPEESYNELEKSVAVYLDEQEKLLWWYRNLSHNKKMYSIQGWRKNKIYPDFVATQISEEDETEYNKVYVIETKGIHLKNEDTAYKQSIFDICNKLGTQRDITEIADEMPDREFEFQVVYEDEWKKRINKFFE